ncbi:hypothetical protein M9458_025770, partial [Cirrhinus mrigala]
MSPCVFTKVAEAGLAPLREVGIRILNYLDDWLILAHSRDIVCTHRDVVLNHLARLGLRVNWEKSKVSPVQCISFLGVELDSVSMTARLSQESTVSAGVRESTQTQNSGPPGTLPEAPGAHGIFSRGLAAGPDAHGTAAALTSYPSPEMGMALRHILCECHRCASKPSALGKTFHSCGQGRFVVTTDSSKTGWGAVPQVALAYQLPRVVDSGFSPEEHVLVRTDNTVTVAYINHQGGVRYFHMSQLARHHLLWSQHRLKSLRATHNPGEFNRVADSLRVEVPPSDGPADLESIQPGTRRFLCLTGIHSLPVVVWTNRGSPRDLLNLIPQTLTGSSDSPVLAQQNLVLGPCAPLISSSMAHSSEVGPPFSEERHNLAPASRSLEPPPMVPGRDQEDFRYLPPSVVNTLLQARAPSTRQIYDLKWHIFVNWCSSQEKDPRRCGIEFVLSFLQGGLDRHLSASTLKVHVAAISTNHDLVEGRSVGKHDLIIRFLRGARRLNPPRPNLIPSWDLAVVLQALQQDPFEPLQSTALLTALTSVKRVGDLQALCVNSLCLEFRLPWPGYVLKVPTTPFRDQVVTLQAIPSQEGDPSLTLLCPVCALRNYLEHTQSFRRSEQLFVCYGGQQKGRAVSKQRISHWHVDAIRMAYQARGLPCPLGVRAHSIRGVAASVALANGASLTDIICRDTPATPNTFARFYSLRMEPVSTRVLNASSSTQDTGQV